MIHYLNVYGTTHCLHNYHVMTIQYSIKCCCFKPARKGEEGCLTECCGVIRCMYLILLQVLSGKRHIREAAEESNKGEEV